VHLADGEPFTGTYEPLPPHVRAVAIGWLDVAHRFTVGSVGDRFVARLFEACRDHATARTRGWHRCSFCPSGPDAHAGPTTVLCGVESLAVGDAEIRLVAHDGTWLVAPTLVLLYVTSHGYRPPPEFIEAVTSGRFAPF
jgi:hypothetical protein